MSPGSAGYGRCREGHVPGLCSRADLGAHLLFRDLLDQHGAPGVDRVVELGARRLEHAELRADEVLEAEQEGVLERHLHGGRSHLVKDPGWMAWVMSSRAGLLRSRVRSAAPHRAVKRHEGGSDEHGVQGQAEDESNGVNGREEDAAEK